MVKYLALIILSLGQLIQAQSWQIDYDKGEQAFKTKAYKKAVNYLSRARYQANKEFGENSPNLLKTSKLLAKSYAAIEDYQGAISVYKSIVESYKVLDNINTLGFAEMNIEIGLLYAKRSRYKNAAAYVKEGVNVIKRLEGEKSLPYINAYIQYIDLYIEGGALDKAQEYIAQLLPTAKVTLGAKSEIYLDLLYKKMTTYKSRRKYKAAIAAGQDYLKACQTARQSKKAYNRIYFDLALAYRKLQDYPKMLANYKSFLTNQRAIFGKTSDIYLTNLDNAILVYEATNLYEPSISLLKERLDLESNSKNNPNILIDLYLNISRSHIKNKQYELALKNILAAQKVAETRKGVTEIKQINTLYALSNYYIKHEEIDKASASLTKTLDFIKTKYGADYPSYGEYAIKACQFYLGHNKPEEAQKLAGDVAKIYKENKKEKHHLYGDSYKILAQITAEKDLRITREYLKIITASYSAYYGFTSKQFFEANEWLADLEVKLDNKAEARRLYTQLLNLSGRIYGANSAEYQRITKKIRTAKK